MQRGKGSRRRGRERGDSVITFAPPSSISHTVYLLLFFTQKLELSGFVSILLTLAPKKWLKLTVKYLAFITLQLSGFIWK